jgi:hypothetical protein
MKALDEQGRPIIHTEALDARNGRERWVVVMGSDGNPESLVRQYMTTDAHGSGSPHVRAVRAILAEDFGTADLPHEVRHKLCEFLEGKQKTPET